MAQLIDRSLLLSRFVQTCRGALAAVVIPSEAFDVGGPMRWVIGFVAACSVSVGVALLILWALTGFAELGVSGSGLVALILGSVSTTGLGAVLMALSFYSDRSGQREDVERSASDGCRDAD